MGSGTAGEELLLSEAGDESFDRFGAGRLLDLGRLTVADAVRAGRFATGRI